MVEQTWAIADKLILNTLDLIRQLHEQLVQEAETLMATPQADLIDNISANKKQLVNQLEGLNSQLAEILIDAKLTCDQDGIKAYFQYAEIAGLPITATIESWQQIQAFCLECRALNEQNGASIELLALHAKRSLDILKGKTSSPDTYGRDGITQNESLTRSLTFYL